MKNLLILPALALAAMCSVFVAQAAPMSPSATMARLDALKEARVSTLDLKSTTPSMKPVCVPGFCCYYGENGDWWGCSKQV